MLDTIITDYASCSLRCIALVHQDFEEWPPHGTPTDENEMAVFEPIFKDMTMLESYSAVSPRVESARNPTPSSNGSQGTAVTRATRRLIN
jgi:hypothetical protein